MESRSEVTKGKKKLEHERRKEGKEQEWNGRA
jgi:hypothetical protein